MSGQQPCTIPEALSLFSNSCNSGNFRSIYLKRSGFVMFVLFSWCFGCWVCVHLLSFNIYLLSETFGDLWAGTLLFGCPFFPWYINGGTSVYGNYNVPFRDSATAPLCLIFCWWWQRFRASVVWGIRTCHTVNTISRSLNVFFLQHPSKGEARFIMVNNSYVLDGRLPMNNLQLLLFFSSHNHF